MLTAEAVQIALPKWVETVKALKKLLIKIESTRNDKRPLKLFARATREDWGEIGIKETPFEKLKSLLLYHRFNFGC